MSAPSPCEMKTREKICLALLILAIAVIASSYGPRFIMQDFSIYRYATERWLNGDNPYELPNTGSHLRGDFGGIDPNINQLKVWAPPYFLFMMIPFTVAGLDLGKTLYLASILVGLVGWVWLTSRALANGAKDKNWCRNAIYVAVAMINMPWCIPKSALAWGGISVLASIGFFVLATAKNFASFSRWLLFWALVSIKPHIVFGAGVAFMILLPNRERWRSLCALATVGTLFGALLLIYSPHVAGKYLALDSSFTDKHQFATTTLVAVLRTEGVSKSVSYFLSGAVWSLTLLPVVKMRGRSMSFRNIVAIAILFNISSLVLSPYAWTHDYQSALGWLWAVLVLAPRALTLRPLAEKTF
jgi:hypothetical protein